MNCTNCGAVMELAASRRSFTCRHCGSSRFPEPLETDGIRLLGQANAALKCPVCTTGLTHALLHDEPIELCEGCRGILLPRAAFSELVHHRRAFPTSPPAIPSPLDRDALERVLHCPQCGSRFDTHTYGGPGNAVIDSCGQCDVIWLDYREFHQIVDAPGKDRGRF